MGVAALSEHLEAIHASALALPDRLLAAGEQPGFALITAALDARLVGFAASAQHDHLLRIDPIVVSNQLDTGLAHDIATELVAAILAESDLPWADVAVTHDSLALPVLLRAGWRPTSAQNGSGLLVLSGAHAVP